MSYLDPYRKLQQYTIVGFAEEEWRHIGDKSVWHKASWNYWRCLSCNIIHNSGVAIFEDDIRVSRGWRQRLEETIKAIESRFEQNYVLALYSPSRREGYKEGLLFENYEIQYFFGTQGMYFPEKTRVEYANYIHKFGVKSYRIPYDCLLKEYLASKDIRLVSTTPSLVQHIGVKTTGLGGNFHQAPSFLDSLL